MPLRRFSSQLSSGSARNRSGHENFDLDHQDKSTQSLNEDDDVDSLDSEKSIGQKFEDAKEFMVLDE